jgi:mannose/cellobiose epimerase-like protein (N-acyl-D-glucosamine 2-epimerase family)
MTSKRATEIVDIATAKLDAKDWLLNAAAPLWSSAGLCGDGLFAERLSLRGERVDMPRRMRVQARQIYSFVAIGQLGWDGPWREVVSQAVDILVNRGRREDGMFAHLFDADGNACDERRDLYNQAFGLFALGHAAAALDRPDLLVVAGEIMDVIDAKWRRSEGGFWEGEITPCPPYRQNPHMHMFEAALSLHRAGGEARWSAMVEELGQLFAQRFRDSETGAVCEYFSRDWQRLPDQDGQIIEPGHCLEWAWLFETGLPDRRGKAIADGLSHFALAYGICPRRGVVVNEVGLSGAAIDGAARLWPQTERLKCAVIRYRRLGAEAEREEVVAAYAGLLPYLQTPKRGVWYDRWQANGEWVVEDAPASSFYHIVCGLSELFACPA